MKIINVETKEQLKLLYNKSALTLEGIDPNAIEDFVKWAEGLGMEKIEEVYIIKGGFMNESYDLEGKNAYPEDLPIACIIGDCTTGVIEGRFSIGAKWFNDIVNSSKLREQTAN